MRNNARTAWVFFVLYVVAACGKAEEVPPYYFLLFPQFRAGGQRPTQPTGLVYNYNVFLQTIHLQWGTSFDPDFGIPVGIYRLYYYQNGPPSQFYRDQDRLDEVKAPVYDLDTNPFSGSIYFLVTGYDGSAESLPSNVVRVDFTSQ